MSKAHTGKTDDIQRFPDAKHFVSYTGLAPSTYASSSRLVHGFLTKQGNKWLRWAFIEAVTAAVRLSPLIQDHYLKVKSRRGTNDARCSTARKLTAHALTGDRERCLSAGMDGYVSKPIRLQELMEAISKILPTAGTEPVEHTASRNLLLIDEAIMAAPKAPAKTAQ